MKRIKEVCIGIIAFLIYLIIARDIKLYSIDTLELMKFCSEVGRISLAICGIILSINGMRTKVNNKANFMAVSALGISIIAILQLRYHLEEARLGIYITNDISYRWISECLQVLSIGICLKYINEHSKMTKYYALIIGLIGVGILYITKVSKLIDPYLIHTKAVNIVIFSICLAFILTCFIKNYKTIQSSDTMEKRIMKSLFVVKISIIVVEILQLNHYLYSMNLLEYLMQIIFDGLVFLYINELTLSVLWKKIDLGMGSKSDQITKGRMEQKTLVAGAKEIYKGIEQIKKKTLELGTKLNHKTDKGALEYIEKIKNNCHRLGRLSDDILDLSRYESGSSIPKFESTNLSELLGSVIESLEPYTLQKGIRMEYIFASTGIMVVVDRNAIERLFLNLLSNAIKYNKENGSIQVILTERRKKVFICIKDTGIGIPAQNLELIFEKFHRGSSKLSQAQEGSGLGLSIVKSLVELHHGEIKILSKEGKGTLISIGLPTVQES